MTARGATARPELPRVRRYWDAALQEQVLSTQPVGSPAWFKDAARVRAHRLAYVPRVLDFNEYAGQEVLDVGCGIGLEAARFAQGGAKLTGIDLAPRAVALAQTYLEQQGLPGRVLVMDGEAMTFGSGRFDLVHAHGVVQYTADPERMVAEIFRVLRPGGALVMMLYHRESWLLWLSKLAGVGLEHQEAPVVRFHSLGEARELVRAFRSVRILPERFPVSTERRAGWKSVAYNRVFVPAFNAVPRTLTRRWGWHLMIWAQK